ncbi:MAG: hypothetical protein K9K39_09155 [Desulfohalobiaceae bacterium]|nr:hypothetical protein [Desulfohalobiaceae bacterium]
MAERDEQRNQDLEQDEEIIELDDLVVEGEELEDSSVGEKSESAEETNGSLSQEELIPDSGEEQAGSDEDLDFDALFEELEEESEDNTEMVEDQPEEAPLSPEKEGTITGGIHSLDSEGDFDALLEDLDKQDMASLDESIEEEDSDLQISSLLREDTPEEEEKEVEGASSAVEYAETEGESEGGETEIAEDLFEKEGASEVDVDLQDLAHRLERLENAPQKSGIGEDELLQALNELPAESAFWTRLQGNLQNVIDSRIRESSAEIETRIAELKEKMDSLASGDIASRQTVEEEIQSLKAEIPSRQEMEDFKQQLRRELQQEMESQIPQAAARIIREEIQNLRSEQEE